MILNTSLFYISILLLFGCSGEQSFLSEPQYWRDIEVIVETRATPQSVGRYEFLVIATNATKLPADDMVVSLRVSEAMPWRQAIQDGHTGVYRKALGIRAGDETLFIRLDRKGEHITLEFPLTNKQAT